MGSYTDRKIASELRSQLRAQGLFVSAPPWGEGAAAIDTFLGGEDFAIEVLSAYSYLEITKVTAKRIFVDFVPESLPQDNDPEFRAAVLNRQSELSAK